MNLTIFNSWQSDTPHNSKTIRAAIREASTKLELQFPDLHVKIDEATSNQVGALHIPSSILQNISNSDVFIGDLSAVGSTKDGKKKLPNPNVLIELGYAISQLGWDRIVILFNKEHGEFKDLPFDIEKRSCIDFRITSDDDKNGIGQLRENLIARIKQIIEVNPDRPSRMTLVVEKDRAKDIETVKRMFAWMPLAEMDLLFQDGSARVKKVMIGNAEQLEDFTTSLAFHVNDKMLKRKVLALANAWGAFLEVLPKSYTLERDVYVNNLLLKGRKASRLTQFQIEDIDKAYIAILNYARKRYPEIDI